MWKKLCAAALALSIVSGCLLQTVQAASPLTFPGTTTVLFDEEFDNPVTDVKLNNSGAAVWEYSGLGYVIAPNTVDANGNSVSSRNASIETNSSYDVSDAVGAEFVIQCIANSNGFTAFMGDYSLRYVQSGYKLYLFGPGQNHNATETVTQADGTTKTVDVWNTEGHYLAMTALKSGSAYWGANVTYTVTTLKNKITVSTSVDGEVISYELPENEETGIAPNVDLSGTFKVQSNYTGDFAVFRMALSKINEDITVNKWRYETDFKSGDTVDDYATVGLELPSGAVFSDGYVATGSNVTTTYARMGKVLSGDYGFAAEFSGLNDNALYIRFNYIDSDNYYELYVYHKAGAIDVSAEIIEDDGYPAADGYVLRKKSNGILTVLDKKDLAGTSFESASEKCLYTFKVKNTSEGKSIEVVVSISNTSFMNLSYTDTAPLSENGKISIKQSYTGSYSKIYSFAAYSLADDDDAEETVTYAETVIDKSQFLNADWDTLSALNFSNSNNGTITKNSGEKLSFANTSSKEFYMNYNGTLSGAYDFETTLERNNNCAYVDFSRNGDEFYRVFFKGDNTYYLISLQKRVYNPSKATHTFPEETATYNCGISDTGRYSPMTVKVSVRPDDEGNVAISAQINVNDKTINLSATDTAAAPLGGKGPYTNGFIRITQGYCTSASINEFGITKYVTEGNTLDEVPAYSGRFYCGDSATKEMTGGTIYFEYPTARLGEYTAVAALYENYEMTAIKTIKPIDLYTGKVKLFDTSNVDLENAHIKVFFFDNGSKLNQLTECYELR